MRAERRRTPRYPFIAEVEVTDEKDNSRTSTHIRELSLHGCYVEMSNPFPEGANVVLEIYSEKEFVETHATVAYVERDQGMGLTFGELPSYYAVVLNKWLEQAKGQKANWQAADGQAVENTPVLRLWRPAQMETAK
jgi:hypothetical protein